MRTEERILLIGASFWWLGEGLFGPLFAVFAGRVGGNILDISWAWAIFLLVTGALEIVVGRVSDRVGHARMMVVGYFLNAALTFGYLFVHTPSIYSSYKRGSAWRLPLRTRRGTPYATYQNRKQAGWIWGLEQGIESLVTGFSILIGGLIVAYFSFTVLFIIMGAIQTIGAIYQARILIYHKK